MMPRHSLAHTLAGVLMIVFIGSALSCEGPRTEDDLLNELFGPSRPFDERYQINTRPRVAEAAVNRSGDAPYKAPAEIVESRLDFYQLIHIDQASGLFEIEASLVLWWNDSRLVFNDTTSGGCFSPSCPVSLLGKTVGDETDPASWFWKPDPCTQLHGRMF